MWEDQNVEVLQWTCETGYQRVVRGAFLVLVRQYLICARDHLELLGDASLCVDATMSDPKRIALVLLTLSG